MRQIIHLDMDAFFASVEQREQPALKGLPVIVGGAAAGARGVVAAASYEARVYGVHSAMPLAEAKRKCPRGIFLPLRIALYRAVSLEIVKILMDYTPLVETLALDEAFMDVTGSVPLFGQGIEIGAAIQKKILEDLELSSSVGVSYNKFLAKLATSMHKPAGMTEIRPDAVEQMVWPLPISKMYGVGRRTAQVLQAKGIQTIGDLAQADTAWLVHNFGLNGLIFSERARGVDHSPVEAVRNMKSIGRETTFPEDISDRYLLETVLMRLVEDVTRRLRKAELKCRVVTVKWRLSDFQTKTKRTTLPEFSHDFQVLMDAAKTLMPDPGRRWSVRLLGVTASQLVPSADIYTQQDLFAAPLADNPLAEAIDAINERFGQDTIARGRLLTERKEKDIEHQGLIDSDD